MELLLIYHVCRVEEWYAAQNTGSYSGSSQDVAEGFIHFSTEAQLRASVTKHRAGQDGLLLVAVDAEQLGETLRWEPSRGGDLFPHVYGSLSMAAVEAVYELPLGDDGMHIYPNGL